MIVPEVLVDGREIPRIAKTIEVFGNAVPPSGVAITYVSVASGLSFSEPIDMVRYNNFAVEADVIMGSGTTCIELIIQESSNGLNWGDEVTENFADIPGSILMDQLPRRFTSTNRYPFPVTWVGLRFIRFAHRVPPDCSPSGTQIALSVTPYKTDI